jgi:hypothetical protein
MDFLLKNGYIKINNILNDNDYLIIEQNILNNDKIKYFYLKKFIDDIFCKKINNKLNWNILYTKFRFSNYSNANDASTMHRDIQSYINKLYPIFTCLTYLDDAILEIIPESHLNNHYSMIEALTIYTKSKKINIKRGDIFIFYSTLLHRGIYHNNNNNNNNRRLLQVFDVYKNDEDYNKYSPQIIHVLGENTNILNTKKFKLIIEPIYNIFGLSLDCSYSDFFIKISKNKILINFLNIFGLLNSATGYGYNNDIINILNITNYTHISQEGLSKRLKYNKDEYQDLNLYFINKDTSILSTNKYKTYKYYCYYKQFIIYFIIIIIIIILIIKLFSHNFKK